jgi:NAD(P)-dependent dehydrogenase (short-subunit alcohol dehydrogenase family)
MKGVGRPEEMANVLLLLASEGSSHIIGSAVVVDGELTTQ